MRLLTTLKVLTTSASGRVFSSKANTSTSSGKHSSSKSASSMEFSAKNVNAVKTVDGAVPGLSANVLVVPKTEVGPGASKKSNYKNPEYFTYHPFSYAEAEVEMIKFRLPQPSSKAR